jgi:hypothetical protein
MKPTFWIILLISACWIAALFMQSQVVPYLMLDSILPPRILDLTTHDEQAKIAATLKKQYPPSILSWIGACSVFSLSIYGLWASRGIDRIKKQ